MLTVLNDSRESEEGDEDDDEDDVLFITMSYSNYKGINIVCTSSTLVLFSGIVFYGVALFILQWSYNALG